MIHPNAHELYVRKVKELEAALKGDQGVEAREIIRSMMTKVVVTPTGSSREYEAVLFGDLAAVLAACSGFKGKQWEDARIHEAAGNQLSVVAGVGFEPTTFWL